MSRKARRRERRRPRRRQHPRRPKPRSPPTSPSRLLPEMRLHRRRCRATALPPREPLRPPERHKPAPRPRQQPSATPPSESAPTGPPQPGPRMPRPVSRHRSLATSKRRRRQLRPRPPGRSRPRRAARQGRLPMPQPPPPMRQSRAPRHLRASKAIAPRSPGPAPRAWPRRSGGRSRRCSAGARTNPPRVLRKPRPRRSRMPRRPVLHPTGIALQLAASRASRRASTSSGSGPTVRR